MPKEAEKTMTKVVTLKNRIVRRFSKGYHIYIPTAFVEDSDLLKADRPYDLVFQEVPVVGPKEAFYGVCTLDLDSQVGSV